jgi:hypothetical protein
MLQYITVFGRAKQKVDLDENTSGAVHTPGVASIRVQWGATFYRRR